MRVKCFHLQRVIVRSGSQRYAAIRQRAVHVHQQYGNLLGLARHFRRYLHSLAKVLSLLCVLSVLSASLRYFFCHYINSSVHKSCKCTMPSTRRGSSTTTTEVI